MNGRVCALAMDIARREATGAILDAMALMRFIRVAMRDDLMEMQQSSVGVLVCLFLWKCEHDLSVTRRA